MNRSMKLVCAALSLAFTAGAVFLVRREMSADPENPYFIMFGLAAAIGGVVLAVRFFVLATSLPGDDPWDASFKGLPAGRRHWGGWILGVSLVLVLLGLGLQYRGAPDSNEDALGYTLAVLGTLFPYFAGRWLRAKA